MTPPSPILVGLLALLLSGLAGADSRALDGNMLFTGTGGPKNVHEGTQVLQDACNREYKWACDRLDALGAYDPNSLAYDRLKDLRGG